MGAIQTFARKEIKFLLTEQQYQDFLPLLEHYMNPAAGFFGNWNFH